MYTRFAATSWGAAAFVALIGAGPAQAQIFTSGHGDVGAAYEGPGDLYLHYHLGPTALVDGSPVGGAPDGVEFDPDQLITMVANPFTPRPAGAAWDFTGTSSGSPIWILPQANDPARPFLGIAAEELEIDDWSNFSFRLTGVVSRPSASAEFSLWQAGVGDPVRVWDTQDDDFSNDVLNVAVGGHDHYNWTFTEEGLYELTFEIQGAHAVDGFQSDSGVFSFQVGNAVPEPGSLLLLGAGLTFAAFAGLRRIARPGPAALEPPQDAAA